MEADKKTLAILSAIVAAVGVIVAVATFGFSLLQGSQDTRRKGLDLKSELIDEVTTKSTNTIVTGRQIVAGNLGRAAGRPRSQVEQDAFLEERKAWFQARFGLAASIATTYSDDGLVSEWDEFAVAVAAFLNLSLPRIEPEVQRDTADALLEYLGEGEAAESGALVRAHSDGLAFKRAYFHASIVLFDRLDQLADRLGSADLKLY